MTRHRRVPRDLLVPGGGVDVKRERSRFVAKEDAGTTLVAPEHQQPMNKDPDD